MFQDLQMKKGGKVTFGGNQRGKIAGVGKIGIPPSASIDNVLFVEGLRHNLLSISQLCDSGYGVIFNKDECIVQNNLYKIKLVDLTKQDVTCLVSVKDNQWTWHKKLGHANMRLISKLKRLNLVRGLPDMSYQLDGLCEAC